MLRAFGTSVLVATCLWTYAGPAAACGACACDDQPRAIINLIRDVPLNLELPLRVLSDGEAAPWLERAADGAKVPATVTQLASPSAVWWLKVDQDLEPSTDYRIVGERGAEAGFTTGTARDELAPTLGDVSVIGGGNADLCDESVGGHVTLSGADDGPHFAVWLELEVDIDGTAQTLFTDYDSGGVRLGHSAMGCFGPNELPGFVDGGGYPTRLRLHDVAGNVGEWKSFAFTAAADQPGGCGDSAAGGPAQQHVVPSHTSKGCSVSPATPRGDSALATLLALGACTLLTRRRHASDR